MTEREATVDLTPLSSWELFVLRHRKRGNIAVHFVAFVIYYAGWVLPFVLWDWRWLLLLPLSGLCGASGHYLFRDGGVNVREATHDPRVVLFVTLMFFRIARGTYAGDIERAQAHHDALAGAGALEGR